MKKTIFTVVTTIVLLLSCSSSDENITTLQGTWQLASHSDINPLPNCMQQTTITFSNHGNLSGDIYELNGSDCDKNTLVASYEKETETTYTIILQGGNSNTQVTVELIGNKLIWTEKSQFTTRVLNFIKQ